MSEKEKWLTIVPLNNFDSDIESFKLDNEIYLRRISAEEIKRIKEAFQGDRAMHTLVLTDAKYVIEMPALIRIGEEESILFDHKQPRIANIILALRLLKKGDVGVSCGWLLDENRRASGLAMPSFPTKSTRTYFLARKEIQLFMELWKKLQNLKEEKPYLNFPLFRFTRAFEEDSPDRKIVEYMTVLESVVFYGEEKSIQPAGKIIGIAIGMLLGTSQEERIEIKKSFVRAYTFRNWVVHGNLKELREKQGEISEISSEIEDYIRNVCRKLIEE